MVALNPAGGAVTTTTVNTQANAASTMLSGNFDTFIKLLTSQLQYQDPLEPTDVSEFTQQLVQYSQVEQQIGTNSKLDDVLAALSVAGGNAYLNYIGHTVDADSDSLILRNSSAQVGYTLPDIAGSVKVEIRNSAGVLVQTLDGNTSIGRHTVQWDGKDKNGSQVSDGSYTFKVVALNAEGGAMSNLRPFMSAQVIGVQADAAEGALLDLGGFTINPAQVYAVRNSI
ncbi:MAG: flagellar hook assembly protein FlgD [Bdellovibrionales bacterium]